MATSNLALVEHTPQTSDEQLPRPNKYKYEEFDGPRGEEYLNVILQQVLPAALWRTWHWAVSFQAPGHPLYVSVGKLAERMRPGERKVYLDLQELEARHLLQTTHTRMEIIQSDGSISARVVTIKNFERLYDLAHESFTMRFFIKPPPEPHELWSWCSSFWEARASLATVPV